MRIAILLLCLTLVSLAQAPVDGRVKAAYRAIPHRQTDFTPAEARMSQAESSYLSWFFGQVNLGVALRVETMQGRDFKRYDTEVAGVIAALKGRTPPSGLKPVRDLVISALEDQRAYFADWAATPRADFQPSHAKVQSASSKLKQAYGALMQRYPGQKQAIQDAFFDGLCALDFL